MGAMKRLWCEVHEILMEEYAAEHPDATDAQCCEATVDLVNDRIADMGDAAYDRWKDTKGGHG